MKNAGHQTPISGAFPFLIGIAKWKSVTPCREMLDVRDYTTLEDLPAPPVVGNSRSALATGRTDVERETTDED
jgi:hypothetical protein